MLLSLLLSHCFKDANFHYSRLHAVFLCGVFMLILFSLVCGWQPSVLKKMVQMVKNRTATLTCSQLRWEAGRTAAKCHHSTLRPCQLGSPTPPAAQNTLLNTTVDRIHLSSYITNSTFCYSPPSVSTPQSHTADKSQLTEGGCCCCPDSETERGSVRYKNLHLAFTHIKTMLREKSTYSERQDNKTQIHVNTGFLSPLLVLTLLSLGLSNGGRLSFVTMMIRPW